MLLIAKGIRRVHVLAASLVWGVLITAGGAALAQAGQSTWRDGIDVRVESAEPVAGNELLVRLPAVTNALPTSIIAKLALRERGSFFAQALARIVIGADDKMTDCITKNATIRRGAGTAQQPAAPLVMDVCPLLRTSAHFSHAVDVNGQAAASAANLSIDFAHTDQPPIAVRPFVSRTSGHVLSENGEWADGDTYVQPNGTTIIAPALPALPHMPNDVLLTASDKPGGPQSALRAIPIEIFLDMEGRATGCRVMQSSGNDRWDAAGCRIALQRAHFTAAKDGFGHPAKGLYEAVADWTTMRIHPARE